MGALWVFGFASSLRSEGIRSCRLLLKDLICKFRRLFVKESASRHEGVLMELSHQRELSYGALGKEKVLLR